MSNSCDQSTIARSVCWRGGASRPPRVTSRNRSSSPVAISTGETDRSADAASSSASGMPSSLRQIDATEAELSRVTENPGEILSCSVGEQVNRLELWQFVHRHFGRRDRERWHPVDVLRRYAKRFATGRQYIDARAVLQERLRHGRGSSEQVLAVVEKDQHRSIAQRVDETLERRPPRLFSDAQHRRDGRRDAGGIADRRKLDQPYAVARPVRHLGGEPAREPRLAAASGTDQCDQPGRGEECAELGQLSVPADEARQLLGQVVRRANMAKPKWRGFTDLRHGQCRVLVQDATLERDQVGTRLDAELLAQAPARLCKRTQRVALPTGPIAREHPLTPQPLIQRILAREAFELAQHLVVFAALEPRVEPPTQRLDRAVPPTGPVPPSPTAMRTLPAACLATTPTPHHTARRADPDPLHRPRPAPSSRTAPRRVHLRAGRARSRAGRVVKVTPSAPASNLRSWDTYVWTVPRARSASPSRSSSAIRSAARTCPRFTTNNARSPRRFGPPSAIGPSDPNTSSDPRIRNSTARLPWRPATANTHRRSRPNRPTRKFRASAPAAELSPRWRGVPRSRRAGAASPCPRSRTRACSRAGRARSTSRCRVRSRAGSSCQRRPLVSRIVRRRSKLKSNTYVRPFHSSGNSRTKSVSPCATRSRRVLTSSVDRDGCTGSSWSSSARDAHDFPAGFDRTERDAHRVPRSSSAAAGARSSHAISNVSSSST